MQDDRDFEEFMSYMVTHEETESDEKLKFKKINIGKPNDLLGCTVVTIGVIVGIIIMVIAFTSGSSGVGYLVLLIMLLIACKK